MTTPESRNPELNPPLTGKGGSLNPKPWRITFTGKVATVIDASGGVVLWSNVEEALNASSRVSAEREKFLYEIGKRRFDTWTRAEIDQLYLYALGCDNLRSATPSESEKQDSEDDPFCWYIVQRDITDEYSTAYSEQENCPGPGWKPLYAAPQEDPGMVKILTDLLDRAYKMHVMAGTATYLAAQDADQNDPLLAWLSDVRSVLYGKTKLEPRVPTSGEREQSK